MSTALAIKEIQIKMTLRFYLTPVRMTIIRKTNNSKCGKEAVGVCGEVGMGKGNLMQCW
jgi:hypothetical protein